MDILVVCLDIVRMAECVVLFFAFKGGSVQYLG